MILELAYPATVRLHLLVFFCGYLGLQRIIRVHIKIHGNGIFSGKKGCFIPVFYQAKLFGEFCDLARRIVQVPEYSRSTLANVHACRGHALVDPVLA